MKMSARRRREFGVDHALSRAYDAVGLEEMKEPILDGKVATELLAVVTRDRMVPEDINWVTTKGARFAGEGVFKDGDA